MKIVITGTGGREHALASLFHRWGHQVIIGGLSDALSRFCECLEIPTTTETCAELLAGVQPDFVLVGPEAPLVAGLADRLRALGVPTVGPGQAWAKLEGSKVYAKAWMNRHGLATAESTAVSSVTARTDYVQHWNFDRPLVVKADGLASGKGVLVTQDREEALNFLKKIEAHSSVVFEEFLSGVEVSLTVLVSDHDYCVLPPAQDHKRRFDGDEGPNTGGMGTVSPPRWWSPQIKAKLEETIITPVIQALMKDMKETSSLFRGVLFIGAMVVPGGAGKIIEFNVRFGDPEIQTLCTFFKVDPAPVFLALAQGKDLPQEENFLSTDLAAATIVVVSQAYPERDPQWSGPEIFGLNAEGQVAGADSRYVHHASTFWKDGRWCAGQGRVLGVTGEGKTLEEALRIAYQRLESIRFSEMDWRHDLGRVGESI